MRRVGRVRAEGSVTPGGPMAAASSGTPAHPAAAASSGTPAHPATHRRRKVAGAVTGALAGGAAVAVAAAVALGGFSSSDASARGNTRADLAVTGGYIPRPILADLAAAYVTVTNSGGTPAELTSVTTPLAAHVTLHTTTGTTMRQVASLTVPAGGRLTLGTGGDHLMLENLTRRPAVGDTVPLTLHFAHATPAAVTVTVPVRPTTYRPGD